MVELVGRYSRRAHIWGSLEVALRALAAVPKEPGRHGRPTCKRHKLDQRVNAETGSRLVADYEAGLPSTELALSYGLGKASVLRLLREAGVSLRRQGFPGDRLLEAVTLYESGVSLAQVGERMGCDPGSVRAALADHGVPIRPRNGWDYRLMRGDGHRERPT